MLVGRATEQKMFFLRMSFYRGHLFRKSLNNFIKGVGAGYHFYPRKKKDSLSGIQNVKSSFQTRKDFTDPSAQPVTHHARFMQEISRICGMHYLYVIKSHYMSLKIVEVPWSNTKGRDICAWIWSLLNIRKSTIKHLFYMYLQCLHFPASDFAGIILDLCLHHMIFILRKYTS